MTDRTAVLLCPGRGSYGKPELGAIARLLRPGPVADALDASRITSYNVCYTKLLRVR